MTCNCKKCIEELTMDDFVTRYNNLLVENVQLRNRINEQLQEHENLREEKRELIKSIEEKNILVNFLYNKQLEIRNLIEDYHALLESYIKQESNNPFPIYEVQQGFINKIEQTMCKVFIQGKKDA